MQRKCNSNKKGNGFTLIELLIVIAVIAVLVAILVPNIRGFRTEANKARAQGDLDTLKKAVLLYVSKYDQLPDTLDRLTTVGDAASRLISKVPYDPFEPSTNKHPNHPKYPYSTYGGIFTQFTNFAIYSYGPGKTSNLIWSDSSTLKRQAQGLDDILATEAKVED